MKQFGGKLTRSLREKYSRSPNWTGNKFRNLEETRMNISFENIPKLLYKQFCESGGREPKTRLPVTSFDKTVFLAPSDVPKFIWYGHSALLLRIDGKTLLIDPMLGPDASPIAPFSTTRFSEGTLEIIDQLPEIDLLLMSHDHYDHLDLQSIRKLAPKVKQYFTALGVARHFESWGIGKGVIREFDWWEKVEWENLEITFTPSRHFSGRGLRDRFRSLWGGWTFRNAAHSLYFSGDSGYGDHFREVGSRLGPFDLGFMECGQYNEHWHQIHMFPEESVQAAMDAGVQTAMPVHWGAFTLAQHHWKDPVERFEKAAIANGQTYITPALGRLFSLENSKQDNWWKELT